MSSIVETVSEGNFWQVPSQRSGAPSEISLGRRLDGARHCLRTQVCARRSPCQKFPSDTVSTMRARWKWTPNDTQPSSLVSAVEPRKKFPSDTVSTVRATAYGRKFVRGGAPARNFPQTPFRRCCSRTPPHNNPAGPLQPRTATTAPHYHHSPAPSTSSAGGGGCVKFRSKCLVAQKGLLRCVFGVCCVI